MHVVTYAYKIFVWRGRERERAGIIMFVDTSYFSCMAHIAYLFPNSPHTDLPLFSLCSMYDTMEEEEYEFHSVDLPDEPYFCPQVEFNNKPDSLFFNDGVRRIDFILVYEDEDKKDFEKRHTFQRYKVGLSFLKSFSVGWFNTLHQICILSIANYAHIKLSTKYSTHKNKICKR